MTQTEIQAVNELEKAIEAFMELDKQKRHLKRQNINETFSVRVRLEHLKSLANK